MQHFISTCSCWYNEYNNNFRYFAKFMKPSWFAMHNMTSCKLVIKWMLVVCVWDHKTS